MTKDRTKENRQAGISLSQAEAYLDQIPKFARDKHTVEDLRKMAGLLDMTLDQAKVIHVAGTNGKGSVCAFLSSVLREVGFHTAVFTSPHLVSVRERFSFDGEMAGEEEFLRAFTAVQAGCEALKEQGYGHPSYFEFLFLMFSAMMQERTGWYAVLETGLGGRLDATNSVTQPALCVITSISRDHMEYLGDTVEKIAGEKAGIIKRGVPVIYDNTEPTAASVIRKKGQEMEAPFAVAVDQSMIRELQAREGHLFFKAWYRGQGEEELSFEVPFPAEYQAVNAMLAVKAAELLKLPPQSVLRGIREAAWPGRMEEIAPGVYLDGAHNEGGIRAFSKAAAAIAGAGRKILLFAVVSDKEYEDMASILCREFRPDVLILTQIASARGLDIATLFQASREALREAGMEENCNLSVCPTVEEAFQAAMSEKQAGGTVFCAGSLYLIGEVKRVIRRSGHGA